jgi:hypothetical protein
MNPHASSYDQWRDLRLCVHTETRFQNLPISLTSNDPIYSELKASEFVPIFGNKV